MRAAALLVCASGCLQSVTLDLDPDPIARTTVLLTARSAYVFDHDAQPWTGVPLSIDEDEPLFALVYSRPIAALQLQAGTILPDPMGERSFPQPDLALLRRDPPFAEGEWKRETSLPEFKLPAYSLVECAEAALCLGEATDPLCGSCTSTAARPTVSEPLPADVSPLPRREICAAKMAHFFSATGCAEVAGSRR